jgi:hypothetical protein
MQMTLGIYEAMILDFDCICQKDLVGMPGYRMCSQYDPRALKLVIRHDEAIRECSKGVSQRRVPYEALRFGSSPGSGCHMKGFPEVSADEYLFSQTQLKWDVTREGC